MKYLAIDTSGDLIVSAANGQTKALRYLKGCTSQHSLTLMPDIEECLMECKLDLSELDFIAAVTGPGSFTGIRIGVSTVKALCFSANVKALALTSFDCLAYDNSATNKCFCVIDANHDNYYCAAYIDKKLSVNPCFLTKSQVAEMSRGYTVIASKELPFENSIVADLPSGLENAVNALCKNADGYDTISPLYVKRSQAEEESC